jgi:hypothetical protein
MIFFPINGHRRNRLRRPAGEFNLKDFLSLGRPLQWHLEEYEVMPIPPAAQRHARPANK